MSSRKVVCGKPALVSKYTMLAWLKLNDRLTQREKRLSEAHKNKRSVFVMESSVSDHGGNGLYALKTYTEGSVLPFYYPGRYAGSDKEFDRLNEYLVSLTHLKEDKNSLFSILQMLKQRWGITLMGQCAWPNWDAIYDSFTAYRFLNTYWTCYDARTGSIYADKDAQNNASLFINEPPPFASFTNRFSGDVQKSHTNVEPFECKKTKRIYFRTTRKICSGNEILMYYGHVYNRQGYDINYNEAYGIDKDTPMELIEKKRRFKLDAECFTSDGIRHDNLTRFLIQATK